MGQGALKNRVCEILELPAEGDRLNRLFDLGMITLILVSVAGVTLRTVPEMMESRRALLRAIEFGSVAIFTAEILLRLWVADLAMPGTSTRPRSSFLRSVEGVIDLVAVAPFYLWQLFLGWTPVWAGLLLLRFLKLLRYSPALATLVAVTVSERKVIQRRFLRTMELVSSVPLLGDLNAHEAARVSRLLESLVVRV